MSVYIIGDLHLSFFPGSDKPMDVFGSRWIDHPHRIAESWMRLVKEEDTVILPGDISWALKLEDAMYDLNWIDQLPGHKVLLKGNHDLWWNGINRLNRLYESMTFLQNDYYLAEGMYFCGSRGWLTPDHDDFQPEDEKIYRRELLRLEASLKKAASDRDAAGEDGELIGLLHYPPVSDVRRFSGFQQLFEDYGVRRVYYGHIHGEDGFRTAVQGPVHGISYQLVSADYLNCRLLQIPDSRSLNGVAEAVNDEEDR